MRNYRALPLIVALVLLLAVPAPGAAQEPAQQTYTVQPGDWLHRIARQHDTTASAILAVNPGITNPNMIFPGQVIVLPATDENGPAVTISPTSGPPQTELQIEARGFPANTEVNVGVGRAASEPTTLETRQTDDEGRLQTEMTVPETALVGEAWVVLVRVPEPEAPRAISNTFTVTDPDDDAVTTYTVIAGDTLFSIANRFGTTVQAIVDANPAITNPNMIFVGQELRIPDGEMPEQDTVTVFLVAIGQGDVGCDDAIVPVERTVPATDAPLTAALEELFAIDEQTAAELGLYNVFAGAELTIDQITRDNNTWTIWISSDIAWVGGVCDLPRVEAQLEQTALQFDTVDEVHFVINGEPMDEFLSEK